MKRFLLIFLFLLIFSIFTFCQEDNKIGTIFRVEKNKVYINLTSKDNIFKDTIFMIKRNIKQDKTIIEKNIGKAYVVDIKQDYCIAYIPLESASASPQIGDFVIIYPNLQNENYINVKLPGGMKRQVRVGDIVRGFTFSETELKEIQGKSVPITSNIKENIVFSDSSSILTSEDIYKISGIVVGTKKDNLLVDILPIFDINEEVLIIRKDEFPDGSIKVERYQAFVLDITKENVYFKIANNKIEDFKINESIEVIKLK